MEVKRIRLRMGHNDKVLGTDLDCSRHQVEAWVDSGVLTIVGGFKVQGAMSRAARALMLSAAKEKVVEIPPDE